MRCLMKHVRAVETHLCSVAVLPSLLETGVATVSQDGNKSISTPRAAEPNVLIYSLVGSEVSIVLAILLKQ